MPRDSEYAIGVWIESLFVCLSKGLICQIWLNLPIFVLFVQFECMFDGECMLHGEMMHTWCMSDGEHDG